MYLLVLQPVLGNASYSHQQFSKTIGILRDSHVFLFFPHESTLKISKDVMSKLPESSLGLDERLKQLRIQTCGGS